MTEKKLDPKGVPGSKKVQLHLVPPSAIQAEARAFEVGAEKYGPFNWRTSDEVKVSTYISACMRHLQAFQDGENMDPDMPRVHHLGAARASLAVLIDATAAGTLVDDRPKPLPKSAYISGHVTFKNTVPRPSGPLLRHVTKSSKKR